MAETKETGKGIFERGINFFEKLHYAIGAVALGASAAVNSEVLAIVGVYELAHGLILNVIKNWTKNRSKNKSLPKLAPAH